MSAKTNKINFAKAYNDLQKTVEWFEKGNVDLEEGVKKFEEGIILVQELKKYLGNIENKVKQIKIKFEKDEAVERDEEDEEDTATLF
ncbi:MAG: Exodeoxyribonuclease 7 small subunit [Candidatus Magasanikbacteria bacterium GW2011_GWC2_40_17]|uniref:Exodeoxyribonuclease VII small subunit n=1 Tax=Candidatus Magasanikbacteria bacterium GW2011_GWA2_42_32 TaxID=1619039 RepID=A0A0G1D4L2_9BACT|nr:MAG: Exodeoxyribonuclease 7 small subunit [Candidatus Magasanikbacteria bacterium GW2011_GWC2_40_17]KKS56973.1 MAG: Exodeoxyribonuclease 7 small subunit [Candidatus Magasanikbacteria bacterium GW2011_GWA2_42_32]OGH85702.1 MAG: exodeoxyribonuclease VII small subunit [Candidatus Magasanikbacteria bacterium RIFOXYB2_FULL_38_10]